MTIRTNPWNDGRERANTWVSTGMCVWHLSFASRKGSGWLRRIFDFDLNKFVQMYFNSNLIPGRAGL